MCFLTRRRVAEAWILACLSSFSFPQSCSLSCNAAAAIKKWTAWIGDKMWTTPLSVLSLRSSALCKIIWKPSSLGFRIESTRSMSMLLLSSSIRVESLTSWLSSTISTSATLSCCLATFSVISLSSWMVLLCNLSIWPSWSDDKSPKSPVSTPFTNSENLASNCNPDLE